MISISSQGGNRPPHFALNLILHRARWRARTVRETVRQRLYRHGLAPEVVAFIDSLPQEHDEIDPLLRVLDDAVLARADRALRAEEA